MEEYENLEIEELEEILNDLMAQRLAKGFILNELVVCAGQVKVDELKEEMKGVMFLIRLVNEDNVGSLKSMIIERIESMIHMVDEISGMFNDITTMKEVIQLMEEDDPDETIDDEESIEDVFEEGLSLN